MRMKLYDITDLKTGEVKHDVTVKEIEKHFGVRVSVTKYCATGRTYLGRYEFKESQKSKESARIDNHRAPQPLDPKLCDEWKRVCAMFKNVEWIPKGSETQ